MICIIQARTTSTRLPNKIFKDIKGKPMIERVVNRLRKSKLIDNIVIATTVNDTDDIVQNFCEKENIKFYRGSENDVLDRYYQTAEKYNAKNIIRITSDCPLICPKTVDKMIKEYNENSYNHFMMNFKNLDNVNLDTAGSNGGFPDGFNLEIFSFKLLEQAWLNTVDISDREHVIPYIRRNVDKIIKFDIELKRNYENLNLKNLHLSVDTQEDLERTRKIYDKLFVNDYLFTIDDVLEYLNNTAHEN